MALSASVALSPMQKALIAQLVSIELPKGERPRSLIYFESCLQNQFPLKPSVALSDQHILLYIRGYAKHFLSEKDSRDCMHALRLRILASPYPQDLLTEDFIEWVACLGRCHQYDDRDASGLIQKLTEFLRVHYQGGCVSSQLIESSYSKKHGLFHSYISCDSLLLALPSQPSVVVSVAPAAMSEASSAPCLALTLFSALMPNSTALLKNLQGWGLI